MQQKINELLLSMYEEYQATLRVLAKSYGIPDKDIDDIVQETFISYFGHYSLEWTLILRNLLKTAGCLNSIMRNPHLIRFLKMRP